MPGWTQLIQRRQIPAGLPAEVVDQIEAQLRERGGDAGVGVPPSEPPITQMRPVSNPNESLPEGQFDRRAALRGLGVSEPAITSMGNYEHGVTKGEQAALNRPEPEIPIDPVRPQVKRGGFGGTLKHMGAGLLQGLSIGAPMGGGQAIGAGITGAILGAVNPQAIANLKFNRQTMPEFERQKSKAEEEIAKREAMITQIGKRTGYDPTTGKELPELELKRTDRDLTRERIRGSQEERARQDKDRDEGRALRAQAEWDQRHPGEPYPEHVTRALPNLKGERAPKAAPKQTLPHWAQDASGRWVDLNAATGPVQGRVPRDPNEPTWSQERNDARAQDREDRADRREQEKQISAAEAALRRVQTAINTAKSVMGAAEGSGAGQADAGTKQAAREAALVAIDEAVSSYPDLLEGGEGEGKWPYIKWKGGKRPAVQSAAPSRSSKAGHKAGDVVTVNGKKVRIGKIYPDGSFDPK